MGTYVHFLFCFAQFFSERKMFQTKAVEKINNTFGV
jgi:hypothetical protein